MKIESIRVQNYRAFQNARLENLPSFCIFVGANGTGKTTFFDIFGFLRDCLKDNVKSAVQKRGGYKELVSRGHEGEDLEFEIQFRMEIAGKNRLVTYCLIIDKFQKIKREILRYKRGQHGSPFHFLDFEYGKGYAITNEENFTLPDEQLSKEKQEVDSSDILAIKGLGQFARFKAASAFRALIENWHVSDFHITESKGSRDVGVAEHLSQSGDNLPLVAQFYFEHHPEVFETVIKKMSQRVPGISKVEAKTTEDGRLILKYQDGAFKEPFIDRYVSDGTIKMFAYLVLLHDPNPHPLLCVEEPENQLYPTLLAELAEEFRAYTQKGGQVFVSTHSPDFLNAAELHEVYWLNKIDGYTVVHCASDNEQLKAFYDGGDKLGYLWKQGFYEGAHP